MRICLLTGSSGGGGAERVISHLSFELAKAGHHVTQLSISNSMGYYTQTDGIEYCSLFGGEYDCFSSISRKAHTFLALRRFFKQNSFDVIVIFDTGTCVRYYFAMIGLPKMATVIMSERNDPYKTYNSGMKKVWRSLAYGFADRMVFQTKGALDFFSTAISGKGVIIPNPIDCESLPDRYVGERRKTIVGVGRLVSQKNWPMLLGAFSKFVKDYPEYCLEIYGQGKRKKQLEDLAIALGIDQKVKFQGFVDNVYETIRDCAMYVSTSNYEGISNAMLEAMALGMPVICTDWPSGGARQTITDGTDGLLVPVGDMDAAYLAMKRIVEEDGLAERLGDEAYKVRERYPLAFITEQWLNVALEKN